MASENISCDLRCAICPNGELWDTVAANAENFLAAADARTGPMTDIAEAAMGTVIENDGADDPLLQAAVERLGHFAGETIDVVAGEAALRAELLGTMGQLSEQDCDAVGICRLVSFVEAVNSYNDAGVALVEGLKPKTDDA